MKNLFLLTLIFASFISKAQGPNITNWLQNTTETGSYYTQGNNTAIPNNILVNCQVVQYSDTWVYISTNGVPSYPTGPFLDGNPSNAQSQNAIYRFSISPQENTGTKTQTNPGNIGNFINGVSLFDYRDGVAWNPNTNSFCGGPGNPPCPGGPMAVQDWNRDAVVYELDGFDCAKGHPAMGNYHHHQNPSAFKLDLEVVSTICNLYDADGLYAIDPDEHSPLIGYANDGFPIYGAYGFNNADGTGGLTRIRSGYELRDITIRNTHADGSPVSLGAPINNTYPLGSFREDYQWVAQEGQQNYLDQHNGRFAVTPEYPNGTYAYYATVNENYNSVYPYVIGPTFFGEVTGGRVNNITEPTTVFENPLQVNNNEITSNIVSIYPNPTTDLVAIQLNTLVTKKVTITLKDIAGKLIQTTHINPGGTIAFFDIQSLYEGVYLVKINNGQSSITKQIIVKRD
ncbi:MAG: YHYH protein [Patiriisocius sp.]